MTDTTIDIEVVRAEACTVCRPRGELDAASAGALRDALATLAGHERVVLDLDDVAFMDSAGLAVLIGGVRRIRDAGGDAAIACDRQPLRRLLHTAGLDRIVALVATAGDAAAALAGSDQG